MKDGFKVIDADRHILEPSDLYQRYLPEKFKGPGAPCRAEPNSSRGGRQTGIRLRSETGPRDGRTTAIFFLLQSAGVSASPMPMQTSSTRLPTSATWTAKASM